MILHILNNLTRSLDDLEKEILAFKDEGTLWKTSGIVSNSPGNLCLHICGNLWHFIGEGIGKNGYVRNRDKEFSDKGKSPAELVAMIHGTKKMLTEVLSTTKDEVLNQEAAFQKGGNTVTNAELLLRLCSHAGYHLGQVNYFRRMI